MYEKYLRKEKMKKIELFGAYLYSKNKTTKNNILREIVDFNISKNR